MSSTGAAAGGGAESPPPPAANAQGMDGILIAGETPEVNGAQIHQDKLGEYVRTGGTMNGRPAYFKDNKCALPRPAPAPAACLH